jgi:hypothetical protein
MHNPIGNYTSFAAARTGQNEQRPVHGFNGFALLGIEFGEEIGHARSSIACLRFYRKGREGRKEKKIGSGAG